MKEIGYFLAKVKYKLQHNNKEATATILGKRAWKLAGGATYVAIL